MGSVLKALAPENKICPECLSEILKEDIKHPLSTPWWNRFLDMTAPGLQETGSPFLLVLVERIRKTKSGAACSTVVTMTFQ